MCFIIFYKKICGKIALTKGCEINASASRHARTQGNNIHVALNEPRPVPCMWMNRLPEYFVDLVYFPG